LKIRANFAMRTFSWPAWPKLAQGCAILAIRDTLWTWRATKHLVTLIGISTHDRSGHELRGPSCSMSVRLVVFCTFALLGVPLLPACGAGSTSEATSGASSGDSSGASSGASSGTSSGANGGASSGAGSGATGGSGSQASSGTSSGSGNGTSSGVSSGASAGAGSDSGSGTGSGATSGAGSGASSGASSDDAGTIVTPAVKATMYLDNWSGTFANWATKIDFTKMTHLILAFATVSGTNSWNDLGNTADVQTLTAAAHAKNVKVLVSIGGAGGDASVINAYKSASNIGPLVANLNTMVTAMNLDGVDVDLETGSGMRSSSNYPAFVSQLLSTFHPEGKLVTTASAQYIVQDQNPDATIVATLKSFDFVNDMIYSANMSDFTNEATWWTGSTVGLPKDNLVWGVCFGECGPAPSTATLAQITTASKAYGGVMCWDYTDKLETTLWPAVQSAL
jgi:hypothetical protein